MRALSTRNDDPATASRPWDQGRDGFVVGEGAGVLLLEEYEHAVKRGATILSELVGYAANSDAYHTNAPPEDGRGVRRVMQLALQDAGVAPSDIKYLNAHATSTPLGDRAEARAICDTFGESAKDLLVSSTKSMTGHLLGGAGSLEAGITVLALRDQIAPPMTNLQDVDEACGFCLVRDKGAAHNDGVCDDQLLRLWRAPMPRSSSAGLPRPDFQAGGEPDLAPSVRKDPFAQPTAERNDLVYSSYEPR